MISNSTEAAVTDEGPGLNRPATQTSHARPVYWIISGAGTALID